MSVPFEETIELGVHLSMLVLYPEDRILHVIPASVHRRNLFGQCVVGFLKLGDVAANRVDHEGPNGQQACQDRLQTEMNRIGLELHIDPTLD